MTLSPGKRLVALDAFRGATMALMVLVNNPGTWGGQYPPLRHAAWHGWTITDLVFPSFLWIAGVAVTLSLGKRIEDGSPRGPLLARIFRRAAVLFLLGIAIHCWPYFNLGTVRILGVLQRIAICYAIGSAIFLFTRVRGQILWTFGLLAAYWMMMTLIPVPGYGPGNLEPGRSFASWIDGIVLGAHNYRPTKTWDPEGLISTLPSIATLLLGVLAGHILRLGRALAERTTWMFLTGSLLVCAGLICDVWMPINKQLWTPAFTLFMGGLDFIGCAICVWLIDDLGWQRPVKPLVVLGMNAIAVYAAAELLAEVLGKWNLKQPIWDRVFAPLASTPNASLLYSLTFVALMYVLAWFLHRRGWFLRV